MATIIQYGSALRVIDSNARQEGSIVYLLPDVEPTPPTPPSPEGSIEVILYKNKSDTHRVDKTEYLTQVGSLMGVLREACSLISPSINVQLNYIPNFNYVYIPIFNRYYYVTNVTSIRKDLWEISLDIDVLMTYRDGIKKLDAFVVRNEHTYNDFLIDDRRVIEQGYDVDVYTLQNDIFDVDEGGEENGSFVVSGFAIGTEANPDYNSSTETTKEGEYNAHT